MKLESREKSREEKRGSKDDDLPFPPAYILTTCIKIMYYAQVPIKPINLAYIIPHALKLYLFLSLDPSRAMGSRNSTKQPTRVANQFVNVRDMECVTVLPSAETKSFNLSSTFVRLNSVRGHCPELTWKLQEHRKI